GDGAASGEGDATAETAGLAADEGVAAVVGAATGTVVGGAAGAAVGVAEGWAHPAMAISAPASVSRPQRLRVGFKGYLRCIRVTQVGRCAVVLNLLSHVVGVSASAPPLVRRCQVCVGTPPCWRGPGRSAGPLQTQACHP